ncbi:MAG TPA: serine hydrolase domain-containing protein [Candidatus Baltobacteraceae bacterium]|jgi:CubicO group peptidase (beta-lactamase class C family)|nr:serine hydrolase domain-containing protein [Candidatus Baltobacteraceae bacterium]
MTHKGFWAAAFAATLAAAPALPASADPLSAQQQAKIDAIARQQLSKQHISGLTIGVGRNGTLLFARGYGLRDRARKLPADAGTVYAIGSITKQFTAAAVLLLAQSGQVDTSAKLSRYLPSVRHSGQVTVRELLDQISGLQDYLVDKPLLDSIENGTVAYHPIAYYVNVGAALPLEFPPGSKWAYSNTNYAALGLLVERVSGESYQRFLANEILQSRMPHTTYLRLSLPPGNDASQGYNYAKDSFSLVKPYDMGWANAAGALASTVGDLVTWDGLFFGGRIVRAASLRSALIPPKHRPLLVSKDQRNNIAQSYASGWVRGEDEGRNLIWHNGGTVGYRTMNLVFPGDGLEVIVFTNATDGKPENIALQVARMLYRSGK